MLNDAVYWYVDSSCNRNKIHTYATFKKILSDSILNKCYAVLYLHIVQLAIETMLSLSEMYHDTLKSKEIQFLMQAIDKKERQTN